MEQDLFDVLKAILDGNLPDLGAVKRLINLWPYGFDVMIGELRLMRHVLEVGDTNPPHDWSKSAATMLQVIDEIKTGTYDPDAAPVETVVTD